MSLKFLTKNFSNFALLKFFHISKIFKKIFEYQNKISLFYLFGCFVFNFLSEVRI